LGKTIGNSRNKEERLRRNEKFRGTTRGYQGRERVSQKGGVQGVVRMKSPQNPGEEGRKSRCEEKGEGRTAATGTKKRGGSVAGGERQGATLGR